MKLLEGREIRSLTSSSSGQHKAALSMSLCENKMKKHNSIQELIVLLEEEKTEIEERIIALKTLPVSFEDEIILKYIETRSTVKAAEFVKAKGIRSPKGTVYAGGDVSTLIKEGSNNINRVLLQIASVVSHK